ncbi:MAG: RNA polymerase sigma factor [Clostridia bacterium]|nr:RNA polymerase sigma factor [Clostridia bacterium]
MENNDFTPNEVSLLAERAKADAGEISALWSAVFRFVRQKAKAYARYCGEGTRLFDAEDLIQESYIALSEAVQTYDAASGMQFVGWLYFYMLHHFRDLRGRKSDAIRYCKEPVTEDVDGAEVDVFDLIADESAERDFATLLDDDAARFILRKMDALLSDEEKCVLLCIAEGRTVRAIAAAQGVPPAAVRTDRTRARAKMARDKELREIYCRWYGQGLHKGYAAFNTSWSSVVEDAVIRREDILG